MSFAPYIHKSLIMAPVFGIYMYIFIYLYTCLRWYQRAAVDFAGIQVHLCVLGKFVGMSPFCGFKKNPLCWQVSSHVERGAREQYPT